MRGVAFLLGVVLTALLAPEAATAQCAMCRTALESPEAIALAAGFRRGVLFLLAAPFTALGVIAGLVTYRLRRAGRSTGPESPVVSRQSPVAGSR